MQNVKLTLMTRMYGVEKLESSKKRVMNDLNSEVKRRGSNTKVKTR